MLKASVILKPIDPRRRQKDSDFIVLAILHVASVLHAVSTLLVTSGTSVSYSIVIFADSVQQAHR